MVLVTMNVSELMTDLNRGFARRGVAESANYRRAWVETSHDYRLCIIIGEKGIFPVIHLDRASTGKRREVYRTLERVRFGILLAKYERRWIKLYYLHVIIDCRSLVATLCRDGGNGSFDLIMIFKIIIILLFIARLLHSLRSVEARESRWSKQGCPPVGPLFVWKTNSVVTFVL